MLLFYTNHAVMRYRRTKKALVMEDGLAAVLGHPSQGGVEPLKMAGNVVGARRPELRIVRKQIR